MNEKVWAVLPAAGQGRRMQSQIPKQYLPLLGATVLEQTVKRLLNYPRVEQVVLVLDSDDRRWAELELSKQTRIVTAVGGEERVHSVLNGLQALAGLATDQDWVMVHDVARPCFRYRDLDRLLEALGAESDGALLAVPVADTLKRSQADGCVAETVSRVDLWRAYTPQVFRYAALKNALEFALKQGLCVTDDASAMEAAGYRPKLIECAADNQKITFPDDLRQASLTLSRIQEEENSQ